MYPFRQGDVCWGGCSDAQPLVRLWRWISDRVCEEVFELYISSTPSQRCQASGLTYSSETKREWRHSLT